MTANTRKHAASSGNKAVKLALCFTTSVKSAGSRVPTRMRPGDARRARPVAAGSDPVCVTGFDLTLSGRDFRFEIVLPESVVEPIRHLRDAGQPDQAEADSRRWSSRLKADVQDAHVSLRAVLARTEISLRDLTLAKPGDIIPTDLLPAVLLYAGDTPLVEGTFGSFQGRNAVRVTKPANRIIVGEKYGRGENT